MAHPALTESRQQSITLTRLIASLRLPSDEDDVRPQRRGSRGLRAEHEGGGYLMRRRDRLQIDPSAVEDVRSTFAALFERNQSGTLVPCVDANDGRAFGLWLQTFYDCCDRANALELD